VNLLPSNLRQFLLDQPDSGGDVHVASVTLRNGRVYDEVAIYDCALVAAVKGRAFVPFDARDVASLRVTNRRWGRG
jgi:hypothetical protein